MHVCVTLNNIGLDSPKKNQRWSNISAAGFNLAPVEAQPFQDRLFKQLEIIGHKHFLKVVRLKMALCNAWHRL